MTMLLANLSSATLRLTAIGESHQECNMVPLFLPTSNPWPSALSDVQGRETLFQLQVMAFAVFIESSLLQGC
jgi:hypothetical protein